MMEVDSSDEDQKNNNNIINSLQISQSSDDEDGEYIQMQERDEYLEETGCALTVRDVSELLHAQYAIITGGKSRDNCPIITFPDLGNFHQLGDEEYRKLIIYHFKNALKMSLIGLTENVKGNKGDMKKFEVWLQGRQEVYTILAPSLHVKETWVKEIKKVLFDQFEHLKGENIKQYSARIQKGASLNGIRIPPLSPTAQHRALRQTASWDVAGGSSVSSSSSDSGKTNTESRESNRRSKTSKSSDATSLGEAPEEEEESWSSEYSPSDEEEEDQETFSENTEFNSSRFLVLADYNAMGSSEVSLRDGDTVDLIKVGCAGWWYVRVSGAPFEGWAPAAYLERVVKKNNRTSPSVSSQESSSGIRPATSRSSVASVSNKSDEVQLVQ